MLQTVSPEMTMVSSNNSQQNQKLFTKREEHSKIPAAHYRSNSGSKARVKQIGVSLIEHNQSMTKDEEKLPNISAMK